MIKIGDLVYRHSYDWGKYKQDYVFKVGDVTKTAYHLPLIPGHSGNGGNSKCNIKKLPKVKRVIKVTNQTMFDALDRYYQHLGYNLPSGNGLSNKVIGDYLVECEGNQIFYSYTDLGLPVIHDTDFAKTVGVKFRSDGKTYHYFANGINAEVYGKVLVKDCNDNEVWLEVQEVARLTATNPQATKQILAYVKPGESTAAESPKEGVNSEVLSTLQAFERELLDLQAKLGDAESIKSKLASEFELKLEDLDHDFDSRLKAQAKELEVYKTAQIDVNLRLIEENAKLRLDLDVLTQYNQADQKQSLFNQICRGWF